MLALHVHHVAVILGCILSAGIFFWVSGIPQVLKKKLHRDYRVVIHDDAASRETIFFQRPIGFEMLGLKWGVFPTKNRGNTVPPKWMAKIMENPINMDALGWKTHYFWKQPKVFLTYINTWILLLEIRSEKDERLMFTK